MSVFQVAALLKQLVQGGVVTPTATVNWVFVHTVLTLQVRGWNVAAAEQAKKSMTSTPMIIQNRTAPTFVLVRVPDPDAQGISKQGEMICVRVMFAFRVLVLPDNNQMESLVMKIPIA